MKRLGAMIDPIVVNGENIYLDDMQDLIDFLRYNVKNYDLTEELKELVNNNSQSINIEEAVNEATDEYNSILVSCSNECKEIIDYVKNTPRVNRKEILSRLENLYESYEY
jgi:hypothetical protein